jgi:hypothetical protein
MAANQPAVGVRPSVSIFTKASSIFVWFIDPNSVRRKHGH